MDTQLISRKRAPGNLLNLPEELLLQVFSFLPPHALATAGSTCKVFKRLSEEESLWRSICEQNDLPVVQGKIYREIYKDNSNGNDISFLVKNEEIKNQSHLDKIAHCTCVMEDGKPAICFSFFVKREAQIKDVKAILSKEIRALSKEIGHRILRVYIPSSKTNFTHKLGEKKIFLKNTDLVSVVAEPDKKYTILSRALYGEIPELRLRATT